jgi:RsmE family RNA methyltransferase
LVRPNEFDANGEVRFEGRRARHLLDVLGVEVGRRLKAGVLNEGPATAEVVRAEIDSVTVKLVERQVETPLAALRLILALPRPKAMRRLLQDTASFGVSRIDLIKAWKVTGSYFGSPLLAPERLLQELILGAEQGGLCAIPDVAIHRFFVPFVNSLGSPTEGDGEGLRLLAHPAAGSYLDEVDWKSFRGEATLAVGPEGGWIDAEVESFVEKGFRLVRLGDTILRTEVAVASGLAQVELMRRWALRGAEESPHQGEARV